MRKHLFCSLLLTLCVLFSCAACQSLTNTKETEPTTRVDLEIVYKRNQLCYSVMENGDDTTLYVFNAAAQPIFDLEGKSATAMDLLPGMTVSLEYDGFVLETYPAQFSGVSEIQVTGQKANSVEFLGSLISGMFPSATPDELERWEITFDGDEFLNAKEKKALEYKMQEEWKGANVVVEPSEQYLSKTGHILITTEKAGESSVQLTIHMDSGYSDATQRRMTISLKDGQWSVGE